jgi:hypothetical protein
MSTPVINAIDQLNQSSLEDLFESVANNPQARDNLSQSNRNIDKVSTNVGVIESLNVNEDAILRMLCRREGRDPANFADLGEVAADQALMQDIATRQESSKIAARSQKAISSIVASQTAMQETINSTTATQEVRKSPIADSLFHESNLYASALDTLESINTGVTGGIDEVAASSTAMQDVAASQTAIKDVVNSQTAMQSVANSQAAMQEVANSQAAMQEVANSTMARQKIRQSPIADSLFHESNLFASALDTFASINTGVTGGIEEVAASQTAMQEIAASQTAMQEIAASQTAMQAVANSQTAINEIGSNTNKDITENTVLNSSTATDELQNSSLNEFVARNFGNSRIASGSITNSRHIVTSNNNNGSNGTGINYDNDVGPQTQGGTTFIINGANANNASNFRGGSVGFDGIEIE